MVENNRVSHLGREMGWEAKGVLYAAWSYATKTLTTAYGVNH